MKFKADINQVKADLDERIKSAKSDGKNNKKKTSFIAVYMGITSAITTVSIGIVSYIPGEYSNFFGTVSLLASASITVVAAWDGLFHHKKLWINAAKTLNGLYELKTDILHAEVASSGISDDLANEFYTRYKSIMNESNERWYKIRE